MKVKLATDTHYFGPSELNFSLDIYKQDILLGDIVDLKNCKISDLSDAYNLFNSLLDHYNVRYVFGNHELKPIHHVVKISKTVFVHGDFELWGKEKALEFRNKKPASGFRFSKKYWDAFRYVFEGSLESNQLDRCVETARNHNAQMLVMGHSHVKNIKRYNHQGIIIYQMPRGFHEIEII